MEFLPFTFSSTPEVYAQKDRLVPKAKEFKYKNPIIKKEVN